jgi:hypothetical protein
VTPVGCTLGAAAADIASIMPAAATVLVGREVKRRGTAVMEFSFR